jgi:hypothetical protein
MISIISKYLLIVEGASHFDSLISLECYLESGTWIVENSTISTSYTTAEPAGDITADVTGFSVVFIDV